MIIGNEKRVIRARRELWRIKLKIIKGSISFYSRVLSRIRISDVFAARAINNNIRVVEKRETVECVCVPFANYFTAEFIWLFGAQLTFKEKKKVGRKRKMQ